MKHYLVVVGAVAALITATAAASAHASPPSPPSAALLARGAYVAKAADCAGCHTAPEHGVPWAGGLGMGSPFGTIVTSNITPDPRYGIGAYKLSDFERAIRHGVARGGKRLYPAMPYVSFSKLSDDDVAALYAYIMHDVPPVAKPTPPSDVAFPFNQRWALRFWQWIFVPGHPYAPKPGRDAQWNRGAYLVQGAGHCGACHTPRGPAYQEKGHDETSASFLAGGINDHWFAPNLTGDPGSGLGRMSEADIAAFLKTGHGSGALAYGSMVEQIEDSTQYLTDVDASAIAYYLKSLPARQPYGGYTPERDTNRSAQNGNRVSDAQSLGYRVYRGFCARCHGHDGKGALPAFPALAGNPSVLTGDTTSLIRLLVEGGNSPSTLTGPPRTQMPAFAGVLTDVQMAQSLTYIRGAWGNDAQPVTANDVSTMRGTLHK
ncbi:cytochrome c [Paraburkholderia caballeronis]|uniref:Cytochrome c, mono-and diheme variants n=1 Tax=Paraburkholderia caballeronis TaxID=416943 RepID=A0A1H7MVA4_9BURK|nr:cytochrome c [Paraburkholderia caballeronis]PXW26417.1 mono/diheme cytochrome c family protein [Paraburkholderia caballeronis]PXX01964.1 mono/diheme cytochrome c family protein [Paraburkholderia caballeronis]RAK01121.1 mono/diheme cytochrome c family protein [Paraburkholderia caballeronis]SEB96835.1 Cytochrome c, mono-and diheme variants [Paraburkholderia caballeronis]SEL14718.1 Cytochrome c, mono-and diheme variants [Paraburkholderia caballeronis]